MFEANDVTCSKWGIVENTGGFTRFEPFVPLRCGVEVVVPEPAELYDTGWVLMRASDRGNADPTASRSTSLITESSKGLFIIAAPSMIISSRLASCSL